MSPGYMQAVGRCFACGRLFSFNPHLVPSIPIKDGRVHPQGSREPICRSCATSANRHRAEVGLALFNVTDEAYGPVEELEL